MITVFLYFGVYILFCLFSLCIILLFYFSLLFFSLFSLHSLYFVGGGS